MLELLAFLIGVFAGKWVSENSPELDSVLNGIIRTFKRLTKSAVSKSQTKIKLWKTKSKQNDSDQ